MALWANAHNKKVASAMREEILFFQCWSLKGGKQLCIIRWIATNRNVKNYKGVSFFLHKKFQKRNSRTCPIQICSFRNFYFPNRSGIVLVFTLERRRFWSLVRIMRGLKYRQIDYKSKTNLWTKIQKMCFLSVDLHNWKRTCTTAQFEGISWKQIQNNWERLCCLETGVGQWRTNGCSWPKDFPDK